MAYSKKTWKDRVSQYLNRRLLTDVNTGDTQLVTVARDEGNVTEAGDTFTASNMNDLEDRIDNGFSDAQTAIADAAANVKSVLLTSSMTCGYSDANTIGYRTTSGDVVDITTIAGYPTGKAILGYDIEYAYCGAVGEYYNIALVNIVGTTAYGNSKTSGTLRFGVRVYYLNA